MSSELQRETEHGTIEAVEEFANRVLDLAQANVPVGDPRVDPDPAVSLRRSGHIRRDGDGFIIVFDTPYAAKVHEDQRLNHPRGGTAKYLEHAVQALSPMFEDMVASRVAARTATGLTTDPNRSHHRQRR